VWSRRGIGGGGDRAGAKDRETEGGREEGRDTERGEGEKER